MRKIIHIDMDCFYAAVEMREDPSLRGKPVAVGNDGERGVVATCNYEARAYGVHSAMSSRVAKQRCPHIIFRDCRIDFYRKVTEQIHAIFREYTSIVEPLSLDEAYLDVTACDGHACDIATEIRTKIFEKTRLTASAGISVNKMLAKIASDWRKPNGQFEIPAANAVDFLAPLNLQKIRGIGPAIYEELTKHGFHTCGDLQKLTSDEASERVRECRLLRNRMAEFHRLCQGHDERPVVPNVVRKSLSREVTFQKDLTTLNECANAITKIADELRDELRQRAGNREICHVSVTVRFSDRSSTKCGRACSEPSTAVFHELLAVAFKRNSLPVRLLGTEVEFADTKSEEERKERRKTENQMEFFA